MKFIEFPKIQDRRKNQLDNIVFSTRVRIARNIEGLNFPLTLSEKDKIKIDEKVAEKIKELPSRVQVETIDEMEKERVMIYLSNHVITNEFLKYGRTLIYEISGDWVILINEDDHIRLFDIEYGYNARQIYNRLSYLISLIEENIDFSFDENYGYLTASILNVGTGLRISAIINLYGLVATKKIENFIETANKIGYSVVNISEGTDSSLFTIYNIYSLGISESDLLNEYEHFLNRVYHLEMKAREEFFNKKEELEISFEELFEIRIKDKIDWNNLLYYLSLIDALNKSYITVKNISKIRNLLYQGKVDYLLYKHHIDKESVDQVRAKILKNYISNIKYKTIKT